MARSASEFRDAMTLMEIGRSDREIARLTGVPRATVGAWRSGRGVAMHRREARVELPWHPPEPAIYAYLLGVYLGDGHITLPSPRSARLVLTLDAAHPAIVAEAMHAIATTFPGPPVRRHSRMGGSCAAVTVSSPSLLSAFPQHGAGRKHKRTIELREWQEQLTRSHPRQLLRGLIHSDGCRTINRFSVDLPSGRTGHYAYPRYFFSNLSSDIRRIFCRHCELIGVRWTQSNSRNISVSHRASVALMDEFIGPKT